MTGKQLRSPRVLGIMIPLGNGPCSRLFHSGTIWPQIFSPGFPPTPVLNILSHRQVQKLNCILREVSAKATSLCHWRKPMLYSEEQLSETMEYLQYTVQSGSLLHSVWCDMLSLDLDKTDFKHTERWRLTAEFHHIHYCSGNDMIAFLKNQ
ncbi:unnamed protein product [Caretta caretta]